MDWETASKRDWIRSPGLCCVAIAPTARRDRRIESRYHPSTMTTLDDATSEPTDEYRERPATATSSRSRSRMLTYQPGACNIGPAEIARRRRSGPRRARSGGRAARRARRARYATRHSSPRRAYRPAVAASGYLQARLRFCTGFGSRGVFNFGAVGSTSRSRILKRVASTAGDRCRSMAQASAPASSPAFSPRHCPPDRPTALARRRDA